MGHMLQYFVEKIQMQFDYDGLQPSALAWSFKFLDTEVWKTNESM